MQQDQVEANKQIIRVLVNRVINEWQIDELDDFFTPDAAPRVRSDFVSFHDAFPDWRMELEDLIAEGNTVVARFECHGTHRGAWRGLEPTGKTMAVDEVFFFRFEDGRIGDMWAIEDTWTRMHQLELQ